MKHASPAMEQQNQVKWRRDKITRALQQGYNQREISQTLQVGLATVNGDIPYLRTKAKTVIYMLNILLNALFWLANVSY
jgi:Trp operon repressor